MRIADLNQPVLYSDSMQDLMNDHESLLFEQLTFRSHPLQTRWQTLDPESTEVMIDDETEIDSDVNAKICL